jgi:hypothetical protein
MQTNVGTYDRVLRALLGLAVLSLVFVGPKTLWGLLGLIPLLTAIAGTCPIYSLFGFQTCSTGGRRERRV